MGRTDRLEKKVRTMNLEERLKAEREELQKEIDAKEARRQLNYDKSMERLKQEEARLCEALNIRKKVVEDGLVWENIVGKTSLLETSTIDEQIKLERNEPSDFSVFHEDNETRILAGTFPDQNDLLNTITKNIKRLQDYSQNIGILITKLNCEVEDLRRNMM